MNSAKREKVFICIPQNDSLRHMWLLRMSNKKFHFIHFKFTLINVKSHVSD